MNLIYNYVKGQIKLECKSCIEKYGSNLRFIDIDNEIFCIFCTENKVYDIHKYPCDNQSMIDNNTYMKVLKYYQQKKNLFDLKNE